MNVTRELVQTEERKHEKLCFLSDERAFTRPQARRPFAGHLSARLFLSLFLLLCCVGGLRGQEYLHRLETAIDMGTYSGPFTYRDSVDTSEYGDDFSLPEENWFTANDVFYRLAMSSSVYAYLLDDAGRLLRSDRLHDSPGRMKMGVMPGVYYLVVQPLPVFPLHPEGPEGPLVLHVEGKPRAEGEDFFHPADLGTFSGDFSHTVDIEQFDDYTLDYRKTGDHDTDAFRHDVVHRFTLSDPALLTLENCGSGRGTSEPYNYQRSVLMSSPSDTVPAASTEPGCHYADGIKRYVLEPGTYYIYSWGEYFSSGWNLAINIEGKAARPGSSPQRPLDIGSHAADFSITASCDTRQTLRTHSNDKPGKEAYFRLALSVPMELWMDNCGSEVQGRCRTPTCPSARRRAGRRMRPTRAAAAARSRPRCTCPP